MLYLQVCFWKLHWSLENYLEGTVNYIHLNSNHFLTFWTFLPKMITNYLKWIIFYNFRYMYTCILSILQMYIHINFTMYNQCKCMYIKFVTYNLVDFLRAIYFPVFTHMCLVSLSCITVVLLVLVHQIWVYLSLSWCGWLSCTLHRGKQRVLHWKSFMKIMKSEKYYLFLPPGGVEGVLPKLF